jgi:hypothetical protein
MINEGKFTAGVSLQKGEAKCLIILLQIIPPYEPSILATSTTAIA